MLCSFFYKYKKPVLHLHGVWRLTERANSSILQLSNVYRKIKKDFLASAGRVAVTEGGDLGGLGAIPQQAFWPVQSGQNRKTCICLHCLPVCYLFHIIYIISIHTVSYHQSYDPKKSLLFQDLTMTYVLLQWLLLSYSLRKYASLPPLICSV